MPVNRSMIHRLKKINLIHNYFNKELTMSAYNKFYNSKLIDEILVLKK